MKYKTVFSSIIKPIVSKDKDKYLSQASLENLRKFLPDIDIDKNSDLLPISASSYIAGRANLNDDCIYNKDAIATHKLFINKYIDIDHSRANLAGFILNAGFAEFGTEKSLNLEEVHEYKKPFAVTIAGILWRTVNSKFTDFIEETNDPTSPNYLAASLSFEIGFNEYDIAVLEGDKKNLEDAEIVSDPKEVEKLEKRLRTYGGTGKIDDNKKLYRVIKGEIIPLGVGIVLSPAAAVKGIAVPEKEKTTINLANDTKNNDISTLNKENLSQSQEKIVKPIRKDMKITSLKDITEDSLKELKASTISEFVEDELKKANEKYVNLQSEKETAAKDAKDKIDSLNSKMAEINKSLDSIKAEHNTLIQEKAKKDAEDRYNQRMAKLDNTYELTKENSAIFAKKLKDMTDEAFAEYEKELAVFLKTQNKEVIAAVKAEQEKANENTSNTTNASVNVDNQTVVDNAVDGGEKVKAKLPNSSANEPTLKEKYAKAFGIEGFEIKVGRK